ncbi:SDR family NAD(P)-dependent oxidoreductase [Streptomyces sp. NPDC013157]|uniref:SDR family NAD(P)-dependent oxidoreductase n=1 Tax=Streptomyces sp. NPDC013157 TaxID=3364861 RepID=UPI00367EC9BB
MATDPTPRTAVITGAGSRRGIGRATAHALAAAGYHIAVLDLDKEAAEDTAREVTVRHGVEALGLPADVTDADAVDAAIGAVEAALPPVGALVNNAGITSPTRFLDVTPAEWDRILEVNVRGSFLVTHRVAGGMAERGFGRIVFLSSVSAERGGGVFGEWPTLRPRPPCWASPRRSPANSARPESRSTPSPRA